MESTHPRVRIGVVGGGWRAEHYFRIARELPERFDIGTVLVSSSTSASRVRDRWTVRATDSWAEFVAQGPYDFVVLSVPWEPSPALMEQLVRQGYAVLAETPPAPDHDSLIELWRRIGGSGVQVAEQFRFQPHISAQIALADSGLIGEVHTASASFAHGYHGIASLRATLKVGFDEVEIDGRTVADTVVSPRGRDGWFETPNHRDAARTVAWLNFGERLALYDFAIEQYFSPLRARRFVIRGTRGEITDGTVRYLTGTGLGAEAELRRESTGIDGDLEGFFLRRIWMGEDVLYENQFGGGRLSDEELAIAEVMTRMAAFAGGGPSFYGLADGSHDHYLSILVGDSAATRTVVRSTRQPWSVEESALTCHAGGTR